MAVDGDQVTCVLGLGEHLFEAGIACGTTTVEHAQLCQYDGRGGTDGCYAPALAVLCQHGLAHTLVLIQVGCPRHAARQHQQVGIAEVALVEHSVGHHLHTMGRLHDL